MSHDQITIVCPACQTHFHISKVALGEHGRTVRCSLCKKVWFEKTQAKAPKIKSAQDFIQSGCPVRKINRDTHTPPRYQRPLYETFPSDFSYKRQIRAKRWRNTLIALIALLTCSILGLGAFYYIRHNPTIHLGGGTFRVTDSKWHSHQHGGHTILTINGTIANMSDHSAKASSISAKLQYQEDNTLKSITHEIPVQGMPMNPGEIRPFTGEITLDGLYDINAVACSS